MPVVRVPTHIRIMWDRRVCVRVRACVRRARGRLLIDIRAPAVFVWLNARRAKTIGPWKINRQAVREVK